MDRDWGWWTELKLDILSEYLSRFTTASKSARATVYLDLFAGVPKNLRRQTGEPIAGSAARALTTQPPFTRVLLFELESRAHALERALRRRFPELHNWAVYGGNCNERISDALRDLANQQLHLAPTFAFIDPNYMQTRWSTVEQLARHRQGRTKTEMWMLFPSGLALRDAGRTLKDNPSFDARMDAVMGTSHWRDVVTAWRLRLLDSDRARAELRNLMRWRLQTRLGYRRTHWIKMVNVKAVPLYDMIFATDHAVGDKIMAHLYRRASQRLPELRQADVAHRRQRKEEERGVHGLFDVLDVPPRIPVPWDGHRYEHVPPHPPYRLSTEPT